MPTHRLLVIEDNHELRELLELYLSRHGYRVTSASDGPAGLAAARLDPPDAMVVDLVLPGLDGADVIAELRQEAAFADVPVILYTGISRQDPRVLAACRHPHVVYEAKGALGGLAEALESVLTSQPARLTGTS